MSENKKMATIGELVTGVLGTAKVQKPTVYRFEIFKGEPDENGKISKRKVVGSAYLRDGLKTYAVHLKTFLDDDFFLLPNTRGEGPDFIILTREPAQNLGRKYFWNSVGEGRVLDGVNHGLMKLNWDVFGTDLYMFLYPLNVTESPDAIKAEAA